MKRQFSAFLLLFALIIGIFPVSASAATIDDNSDVIPFENGDYIVVTTCELSTRAAGTKTATRSYIYYNSKNAIQWKATLRASFSYTGSSATCTDSSCNIEIYNNNFYVVANVASKSGNTAFADVVMGYRFIGITIRKDSVQIKITCDKDGNLS